MCSARSDSSADRSPPSGSEIVSGRRSAESVEKERERVEYVHPHGLAPPHLPLGRCVALKFRKVRDERLRHLFFYRDPPPHPFFPHLFARDLDGSYAAP